jgi:hypothetical protein
MKIYSAIAALALLAGSLTSSASAQNGCCGGYGWGWGYDIGALYNTLDFRVPYFAAHPPVYYSYPVPRPYGFSPFAYPPGTMTPEVLGSFIEPATIINPYVPSSTQQSSEPGDKLTSRGQQPSPLVIVNPYVEAPTSLAAAER